MFRNRVARHPYNNFKVQEINDWSSCFGNPSSSQLLPITLLSESLDGSFIHQHRLPSTAHPTRTTIDVDFTSFRLPYNLISDILDVITLRSVFRRSSSRFLVKKRTGRLWPEVSINSGGIAVTCKVVSCKKFRKSFRLWRSLQECWFGYFRHRRMSF